MNNHAERLAVKNIKKEAKKLLKQYHKNEPVDMRFNGLCSHFYEQCGDDFIDPYELIKSLGVHGYLYKHGIFNEDRALLCELIVAIPAPDLIVLYEEELNSYL